MDLSIIYTKTGRGARALIKKLPSDAGQILSVMSSNLSAGDIFSKLKKINEKDFGLAMTWLLEGGFIKIVTQQTFSDSVWAPVTLSSIAVSEISFDEFNQTAETAAQAKERAEAEAKAAAAAKLQIETDAREQAKLEAQEQIAQVMKDKAAAKTKAKLEALARADEEARERAEAQVKAASEAKLRAEAEALEQAALAAKEQAAREAEESAAAEAKAQEEAETKAKLEALARADEEARALAEAQAKLEAEAKLKAEAAAEAQAELEAKINAARLAEEEAAVSARVKQEALVRAEAKAKKQAARNAEIEKIKEKTVFQLRQLTNLPAQKFQAFRDKVNLKKVRKLNKKWSQQFFSATKSISSTILKYSIGLLVLALVAAQLINLRMLIKPIENFAAENIQEPVGIQTVHASIFPAPHLVLNGVTVGNASLIKAQSVLVFPDLSALMGKFSATTATPYEIRSIEIEALEISQQSLLRPAAWLEASTKFKQLKIHQILLTKTIAHLNGLELPPFNGDILLNDAGQLSAATLSTEDKSLVVEISQPNAQYQFNIKATNWRSPIAPNLVFTTLNAKGALENNRLTMSPIEGVLYNGQLKANMVINLDNQWNTAGTFDINGINLANAAQALNLDAAIDGTLSAHSDFTFNYNTASNLVMAPTLNARFKVNNGAINKIDLIETMHSNNIGGTTHFAELTGSLLHNKLGYQFRNLVLQDNQLQAYGKLDITANNALTGEIYTNILAKSQTLKSHLNLAGTIDNIKLRK